MLRGVRNMLGGGGMKAHGGRRLPPPKCRGGLLPDRRPPLNTPLNE